MVVPDADCDLKNIHISCLFLVWHKNLKTHKWKNKFLTFNPYAAWTVFKSSLSGCGSVLTMKSFSYLHSCQYSISCFGWIAVPWKSLLLVHMICQWVHIKVLKDSDKTKHRITGKTGTEKWNRISGRLRVVLIQKWRLVSLFRIPSFSAIVLSLSSTHLVLAGPSAYSYTLLLYLFSYIFFFPFCFHLHPFPPSPSLLLPFPVHRHTYPSAAMACIQRMQLAKPRASAERDECHWHSFTLCVSAFGSTVSLWCVCIPVFVLVGIDCFHILSLSMLMNECVALAAHGSVSALACTKRMLMCEWVCAEDYKCYLC